MRSKPLLRVLLASTAVGAASGCQTRDNNETERRVESGAKEFVQNTTDDKKKTTITNLDVLLPKLKAAGIKPSAAVWEHFANVSNTLQARHAKVYFGPLLPADCEKLKLTFVDSWVKGQTRIDCQKKVSLPASDLDSRFNGRVADGRGRPIHFLLDHFLTPVMQATVRYTFNAEAMETQRPATDAEMRRFGGRPGDGWVVIDGKYLDANCWSTAYEVARQEKPDATKNFAVDYDIHIAPPEAVEAAFFNTANASDRTAGGLGTSNFQTWIDRWGVAFGDILLVKGLSAEDVDMGRTTPSLLHAAVFVDKGLVYERVGNQPGLPFRLGALADTFEQYKNTKDVKFFILRMKRALPPVKDDASLDSQTAAEGAIFKTDGQVESLSLLPDASGVFRLDANGLTPGVQNKQN